MIRARRACRHRRRSGARVRRRCGRGRRPRRPRAARRPSCRQDYGGANLDDVDVDALERQLSPAAVRDLRGLRELERELERQGYLQREAGELTLTPKALRRMGESALAKVFERLDSAQHRTPPPVPPRQAPTTVRA
ncbi:MAG: hypothetical protein WKF83_05745 [Nocardioidaceae bacterium]